MSRFLLNVNFSTNNRVSVCKDYHPKIVSLTSEGSNSLSPTNPTDSPVVSSVYVSYSRTSKSVRFTTKLSLDKRKLSRYGRSREPFVYNTVLSSSDLTRLRSAFPKAGISSSNEKTHPFRQNRRVGKSEVLSFSMSGVWKLKR